MVLPRDAGTAADQGMGAVKELWVKNKRSLPIMLLSVQQQS